jgi:hypothetical protein
VTACVAFFRSLFHRFGGTHLNGPDSPTSLGWVSSISAQWAHSRFMSYFAPPSLFQLSDPKVHRCARCAACSAKIENPKDATSSDLASGKRMEPQSQQTFHMSGAKLGVWRRLPKGPIQENAVGHPINAARS